MNINPLMPKDNNFLAYLEKALILIDANDFSTSDTAAKGRFLAFLISVKQTHQLL